MSFPELLQVLRRLAREPAFAGGVVGVLALAIGAITAVFTLVNAVMLRPLPLVDPDRLVTFTIVRPGTDRQPLSLPDLADVRAASRTLTGIASAFGWSVNLTGTGDAERLQGMRVSADYFPVTGAAVALGRAVDAGDEREPVVLLAHGLWQRRFGAAPDVVGRTIVLNGEPFTVIGVLRRDFVPLIRDVDVVAPYSPASDPRRGNRAQGFLRVVARLAPGVTLRQVEDDLGSIGRRLRTAYPDSHGSDSAIRVVPLHDEVSGRAAPMLRLLFGAVALVLLVACANLANLCLVRGVRRRRELAVRAALGASRARVAGHLLAEAVVLGLAGGALGLLVARGFVRALLAAGASDLPRVADAGLDLRVAVFGVAASLGVAVLFGLAPALQACRADVRDGLDGGDRGSTVAAGRVRAWLMFAEIALSTVLLITAALLARSFARVQAVDPGFRPGHVLTVRLSLPRARYASRAAIVNFYDEAARRLGAIPGVRSVAASNVVPMNGYLATTAFSIDGVTTKDVPEVHYRMISPGYFAALGIPLRHGRVFTPADRAGTQPVAIVNETFARQYLQGRNPVGARIRLDDGESVPRTVEVVGVVGDVKHFGLERETVIEAYVPMTQVPDPTTIWLANNMYWVLRTEGDPLGSAEAVRREIAAIDRAVPASFARSMDQWMASSVAARRFNLLLVEAFSAGALLLAVVGVYAVASSAVAARRREIGIRGALGASRREAVALVLRHGLTPVGAGLLTGVAVALVFGRALGGLLFGVTPRDPVSIVGVVSILTAAALAASYVPARRAARVDPIIALRTD